MLISWNMDFSWLFASSSILFKLGVSTALGGIIGLEREFHEKPAGFRTNIIICLGATVFTIASLAIGAKYNQDPGRIAAQVVTGVGFLGAGAIMRDGNRISGLTTAAGIWLVSAIGMAVGYGYYLLAVATVGLTILAQIYFIRLEGFFRKFLRFQTVSLKCAANWDTLHDCERRMTEAGVRIESCKVKKEGGSFDVDYRISGTSQDIDKALACMMDIREITDLEY
ncbi:MAG: MgtC/SapB family protein [Elusimicrobiales bacterium]